MRLECRFSAYIGGEQILSLRDVPDSILYLLEVDNLETLIGDAAEKVISKAKIHDRDEHVFDDEDYPIIIARIGVKELRNKLKVLGYGMGGMEIYFNASKQYLLSSNMERIKTYNPKYEVFRDFTSELKAQNAQLRSLDFIDWFQIVNGEVVADEQKTKAANDIFHQFEDIFFMLAVMLDGVDENGEVIFDFTDLYEYKDEIPIAIEEYKREYGKPIIVTEGSTDIEFISNSVKILYPYLSRYIRFLDTDFKPETNADAILKMAKNFAAAGISENMLFVLDNDSAGRSAIRSFMSSVRDLPKNFRVTQYPSTPLLENYPTKGPQGDTQLDVNGRAGSIEMYLGKDILTDNVGKLHPIQWKGYMDKIDEYQGEVLNKRGIQEKFRRKYRDELTEPTIKDWGEMTILLEHIFDELSNLPAVEPLPEAPEL